MIEHWQYILIGQTPVPEPNPEKWAIWMFENPDNRIVFQTEIGASMVSTVFLGLNHRHFGEGPPILFETMIFGDGEAGYCRRTCTWLEAEAMHRQTVEEFKQGMHQ